MVHYINAIKGNQTLENDPFGRILDISVITFISHIT